jgi:hypothetical protein
MSILIIHMKLQILLTLSQLYIPSVNYYKHVYSLRTHIIIVVLSIVNIYYRLIYSLAYPNHCVLTPLVCIYSTWRPLFVFCAVYTLGTVHPNSPVFLLHCILCGVQNDIWLLRSLDHPAASRRCPNMDTRLWWTLTTTAFSLIGMLLAATAFRKQIGVFA